MLELRHTYQQDTARFSNSLRLLKARPQLAIHKGKGIVYMGAPPLNSEEFMRRAVYHKVYVLKFSVKQRFEAHSFEGLCKTGTIS